MTHSMSLLYWLSAGLYDVLILMAQPSSIYSQLGLVALAHYSSPLAHSHDSARAAESDSSSYGTYSLYQLSKGLLSRCSAISFHKLSTDVLSRSYYDSADVAESDSSSLSNRRM